MKNSTFVPKYLFGCGNFVCGTYAFGAPNHHLSEKPADHDGVEADDEEEGQEVAKDEEAHLHMQMR